MKKVLIILCITLVFTSAFGQDGFSRDIVKEPYYTMDIDRYTSFANYLPDGYVGSPFAEEIFQDGIIYENEIPVIEDYFMRYNAYEDDIEVKKKRDTPDSEIFILTKSSNIVAKISNNLYIYNEVLNGYYEVLFVGTNFRLYKQLNKKRYPARNATSSFQKDALETFKDRPEYFMLTQDDEFHEVPSSNNKRIKFFGNKKSEIEKYVKKHKLDLSDEAILVKIVRLFDSFSDARLK